MTNEEKAEKIGEILEDLYPEPPIPLDHTDGFTLTIAVLLSAQCTDKRVNMVTPGLFELADNIGTDLLQAMSIKLEKNERKYPIEKAKGSHAKYTEL